MSIASNMTKRSGRDFALSGGAVRASASPCWHRWPWCWWLAAAALVHHGAGRRPADRQDVVHTYEVRCQAREVSIGLAEAESGQRGYVLTRNDESYLEPYRRAAASIRH
jgi:hypothetical protein